MFEEMKMMTDLKKIALSTIAILAINGCGDTSINYGDSTVTITGDTTITNPTDPTDPEDPIDPPAPSDEETVIGYITADTTWTADKAWIMEGRITVTNGATLTIEPGTYIAGKSAESYLLIDNGSKIMAEGTAENPITFTSVDGLSGTDTTVGKWGGVTLIGNANMSATALTYEVDENFIAGQGVADDSSGILKHVKILNSATVVDTDKETNGLSMVGVGSGTVVEDITVDYSGDDGVEIWGGTVNLKNVSISNCTDDHLDVDSMYQGTIENLVINASNGYAAIEMSGTDTLLTVDGFTITVDGFADDTSAEGAIFFKKAGVGGKFYNGTIIYRSAFAGAIYSQLDNDTDNIDFENVGIYTDAGNAFVNKTDDATDSADEIETIFASGTNGNDDTCIIPASTTLTGAISGCNVLTRDQSWIISSLAYTDADASVRIQDGTTIGGNDALSYMIIDKDSKIFAVGTKYAPITFTDKAKTDGQEGLWGGLTLIGNANMSATALTYEVDESFVAGQGVAEDSSGVLKHVKVLNSATEVDVDKETNGLSMVGVGYGTVVEDITVDYSNDDGVEIWGGTVNLKNVSISNCTDDHLDVDSMYQGMIENLVINASMGYAAIEMSGTDTLLTLDGFTINVDGFADDASAEGAIFFKKAGVGGKFYNGTINYTSTFAGAIYSQLIPDLDNIDFGNVEINTIAGHDFVDKTDDATDGAQEIKDIFDANDTNVINYI